MGTFRRQFNALAWKNVLGFVQHPFLNVFRCFILPVALGVFLAAIKSLGSGSGYYGIGEPMPIASLASIFDGSLPLYWSALPLNHSRTNPTLTPDAIMSRLSQGFNPAQSKAIIKVNSTDDVGAACAQNFNGFSACFAAVIFDPPPPEFYFGGAKFPNRTAEYTIQVDTGLQSIDVRGRSGYERRIMPLQFAIDNAITELSSGYTLPTPSEWPFTELTNEEVALYARLNYIGIIQTILMLPMFLSYISIAYTLPGAFASERASLLTSHMRAMGLRDLPRILSWYVTHTLCYLPAWIVIAIVWKYMIFTGTHVLLILTMNVLLGLVLASHGLFISVPFGKSPQLAAVVSTLVAIASAGIVLGNQNLSSTSAIIYSLFLPGGFFMFAMHCICSWESVEIATNALKKDPGEFGARSLLPLLIIAAVDVVLYLVLTVLLERFLYDTHEPYSSRSWNPFSRSSRRQDTETVTTELLPSGTGISIRNLRKTFSAPLFKRSRGRVTAISDLSLDIPSQGIFVLLGSNGAGKSTTLSILGNLLSRSSGDVVFANGHGRHGRPERGDIGIVPQKNVLFDDLTCLQNLRVWRAVKRPVTANGPGEEQEDLEQLLRDCDLGKKIHERASTLSGGQKRKLQLAAGLVGGSSILLVDECTSGVDPLSRRAIWRILRTAREKRTIILTTHFLDEADLLGDTVAVLASPGELVAQGTPVELKSSFGSGYLVIVTFEPHCSATHIERFAHTILNDLRIVSASCEMTLGEEDEGVSYRINSKDPRAVQAALRKIDGVRQEAAIKDVDVQGTTMEAVFLELMGNAAVDAVTDAQQPAEMPQSDEKKDSVDPDSDVPVLHAHPSTTSLPTVPSHQLSLTSGRPQSFLRQMLTIFYKRILITRRAWLTPLLAMLMVTIVSCLPLSFVRTDTSSCAVHFDTSYPQPLFLPFSGLEFITSTAYNSSDSSDPDSFVDTYSLLESPPGIISSLGPLFSNVSTVHTSDSASFNEDVRAHYQNLSFGGVSFDFGSGMNISQSSATFAWQASPEFSYPGLTALNLLDNIMYNRALNESATVRADPIFIVTYYDTFPYVNIGNLVAIMWAGLFLAAMAVYPAFFSLYVCRERKSGVQAMQLSNGLSNPAGMWLGHLMHDSISSVIAATIVTIVFATTAAKQFHGLGLFWLVMVLYGVAATLFSYCVSLAVASPLAAFAVTAGLQVLFMVLYLVSYYLVHAYAKSANAIQQMNAVHFTLALISPVANISRAALVSVNLFLLLCDGDKLATTGLASITRYGGPILYLIGQSFFYFGILMWRQSGALFRPAMSTIGAAAKGGEGSARVRQDVVAEVERVAGSGDALQVMRVTKSFGGRVVVDDISFGAQEGTTLALLGPNGAGKTTAFNMIRGDIVPTTGQILIQGKSVISQPRLARPALGVCPQFTAIDALSVSEHLSVYGRLKGLRPGAELRSNVNQILLVGGLEEYRDRQASQLSGGNQRKLALAIALMGNPSVVLIDEFSSGVDAKMKREMWGTLKALSANKAVVITTHSMEEASALANKVAIVAKRMLAVGTVSELEARYATYEVHFSGRSYQDTLRAREVMARVPGAQAGDDLSTTRFQVPVVSSRSSPSSGPSVTLEELFGILAEAEIEFSVERPTLEAVFLKIVREHNVGEDDEQPAKQTLWAKVKNLV